MSVAYFGALEKAWPANNAVRQAELNKAFFKTPHLARSAHQYGNIIIRAVLGTPIFDFSGNDTSLGRGVPDARYADFVSTLIFGPKGLPKPVLIGRDQAGRCAENMLRRAIVTLQLDDFRAGKVFFEAQDIIDFGSAPAIDGLVIIPDNTNIF